MVFIQDIVHSLEERRGARRSARCVHKYSFFDFHVSPASYSVARSPGVCLLPPAVSQIPFAALGHGADSVFCLLPASSLLYLCWLPRSRITRCTSVHRQTQLKKDQQWWSEQKNQNSSSSDCNAYRFVQLTTVKPSSSSKDPHKRRVSKFYWTVSLVEWKSLPKTTSLCKNSLR